MFQKGTSDWNSGEEVDELISTNTYEEGIFVLIVEKNTHYDKQKYIMLF